MIFDGKAVAAEVQATLAADTRMFPRPPRLDIILVGSDPASEAYVKRKQAFGESVGATVVLHAFTESEKSGAELVRSIADIVRDPQTDGVLIQLPLPAALRDYTRVLLDAIPTEKDVDALSSAAIGRFISENGLVLPTMIRVVDGILKRHAVDLFGKRIALVGAGGELVGKPVALWLLTQDIPFAAITKHTPPAEMRSILARADIIISGAGKAGLITADMVKSGVIAIDAGTSGSSGALKGDMDSAIAEKAELFTPVPGGVGPMTVAMLFQNLFILVKQKK